MRASLIIFAKEPLKAKIKTRLARILSQKERIELYKAFVKDTVKMAGSLAGVERILAYASYGEPVFLKNAARKFIFYKQEGKDLGARIHKAFLFAKRRGSCKTVIIGTDSPDLSAGLVRKAFHKLDDNDFVLGPSVDGGYYLVGLKRPSGSIFSGIKWSSAGVFKKTLAKIKRCKQSVAVLPEWYDVDELRSLAHLKSNLKRARTKANAKCTRKYLKI